MFHKLTDTSLGPVILLQMLLASGSLASLGSGAYLVCQFLTQFSETSSHLQREYSPTQEVFTDAIGDP